MSVCTPAIRGAILAGASAFAVAGATFGPAQAQGRLNASYTISIARIPVGKVTWTADIGEEAFTTKGEGEASGLASLAVSGKGTVTASGTVKHGRLDTTTFSADLTQDDEKSELTMLLDHGAVTEIKVEAQAPGDDRVAVTAAHRHNIVDPLTAWLIPAGKGDGLMRAACERTLPIFDGQRRYDLRLSFKRTDKVKIDQGYQGPVAVCAIAFQAIAGHRASSPLVKFLSHDREIEVALAPVAGTHMFAPIRLTIFHLLGNLVLQATKFHVTAHSAARALLRTDRSAIELAVAHRSAQPRD
jgi:Protein of unknown function (DUF3108)